MQITLKNLQKKIPIPRSKILRAVNKALEIGATRHNLNSQRSKKQLIKVMASGTDLSIVFVGRRRMRAINKKFLKHDYVTDVLTFDLGGGHAEIIICPEMAAANARALKTSTEKELILYVIHGLLHLAGFNDHKPKDIAKMREMEGLLITRL